MGLRERVSVGLRAGFAAARGATTPDEIDVNLREIIESGRLDEVLKEADFSNTAIGRKSFLNARKTSSDLMSLYSLLVSAVKKGELPPHGDPTRDQILAEFWKGEPLLAGAVYSMSAKMTALSWTVMGAKDDAKYFADLYSRAASMDGYDWGGFISPSAQDFYTCDRGTIWETPRNFPRSIDSVIVGELADIGHVDALQCAPTGNWKRPLLYLSDVTGQEKIFRRGEYIHFASMTSPREKNFGMGLCASSRAWRAAKLLIGLHDYDEEKLSNLPPEGVASVSGLTMDEFQDALALWKAARKQNNSLTFPQVLWLLGSQPNTQVSVDMVGFSTLPESFNRREVVEQYVNTLALVFGVDAREFWPISSGALGTASETEVQHMKARGKGPGEFISIIERKLNGEMPDGTEFAFDTQDISEDKEAAIIAKTWIEALLPLVTGGAPGGPKTGASSPMPGAGNNGLNTAEPESAPGGGEGGAGQIITKAQFLRLLADRGVLPNYIVEDERVVVTDSGISEKQLQLSDDDYVMIRWKDGVLSQHRMAPITVQTERVSTNTSVVPVATVVQEPGKSEEQSAELWTTDNILNWLKQVEDQILEENLPRGIRGKPIPSREALRGTKITEAAVKAELDRWRAHPVLAAYVPAIEEAAEEKAILEAIN